MAVRRGATKAMAPRATASSPDRAVTTEAADVQLDEGGGGGLGQVLVVALGLAAVAVCVLVPLLYGSRTLPAGPALAQSYELGELSHDFELGPEAFLLPGGERVFVLGPGLAGAPSEGSPGPILAAAGLEREAGEGSEAQSGTAAFTDWGSLSPVSTGTAPARLFLVQYPIGRAASVIDEQFRRIEWKDLRHIEAKGARTAVDGGKIEWGEFAADFVQERTFVRGGTFRDSLRVNLSLGRECWIAYAVWPELNAGSKEVVGEVLGALRPTQEVD